MNYETALHEIDANCHQFYLSHGDEHLPDCPGCIAHNALEMAKASVDTIHVALTERQARAVSNLFETGIRVGFHGVVSYGPVETLTEPEMADLQVRLLRALGEKKS